MTAAHCKSNLVRRALIASTTDTHNALHNVPLLARLSDDKITAADYASALAVFSTYYNEIETSRRSFDAWARFTLAPDCAALAQDTGTPPVSVTFPGFETKLALLGGLYFAHGAAFGRSTFASNLRKALPVRAHHFLTRRNDPEVWRALLDELEKNGRRDAARRLILKGAETSFQLMKDLVQVTC